MTKPTRAADRSATLTNLYRLAVQRTERMPSDSTAQSLAAGHGLQILNVTWEDTGRFKGSAVGPNISDVTIQVQYPAEKAGATDLALMPVIRFPNFSDVTADIRPEDFHLLVGNEKGKPLAKITLREFLEDLRPHLTNPDSWSGTRRSLLVPERDSHVLVSAQACFLPVPAKDIAEFNPVIFNYQTRAGDPAVLTILATREGTSVTVVDNERDGFSSRRTWGQRLFFNQAGERASLTGQRQSEFVADGKADDAAGENGHDQAGLNMVLLIQVPLKQKAPEPIPESYDSVMYCCLEAAGGSDVEDAVIGHGKVEGPFTEIDGLDIERDDRFPIRVTVQFYKATSNGIVSPQDMAEIAATIKRVYREADYVGSLVVETSNRPTEHSGFKFEPPDWWDRFWERHFADTGKTREEAMELLERLVGKAWAKQDESTAESAIKQSETR